jgi:hypothetical protein
MHTCCHCLEVNERINDEFTICECIDEWTAFRRQPVGQKLIVADYGQLELRILAHMTNCRSMIDAFKAGGDFHSRTAMGM